MRGAWERAGPMRARADILAEAGGEGERGRADGGDKKRGVGVKAEWEGWPRKRR